MVRICRHTARYTSNRGATNTRSAHSRIAVADGIAERTLNARAS
jgi:hypothetical protein